MVLLGMAVYLLLNLDTGTERCNVRLGDVIIISTVMTHVLRVIFHPQLLRYNENHIRRRRIYRTIPIQLV